LACALAGALLLAGSAQGFIIDHHCGSDFNRRSCTTIAKQDGRLKFRLKQHRRISRVYKICFKNLRSFRGNCPHRLPFEKRGKSFVGVFDLKRDYPSILKRPGPYSVRWWQHGHTLGPPLHFRVPRTRPGPPIMDAYTWRAPAVAGP